MRAGPLKYTNIKYLENRKFEWSSEKAKTLGIWFTNNKNDILKLNFWNKVKDFNNCLKSWMHRKLTLLGKITVLKSFALPKLVYPLTVLPNPSKEIIQDIINTMFRFIWNGKPNKIKKETLMNKKMCPWNTDAPVGRWIDGQTDRQIYSWSFVLCFIMIGHKLDLKLA